MNSKNKVMNEEGLRVEAFFVSGFFSESRHKQNLHRGG